MSNKKLTLKIFRFDPKKDKKPYYKTYEVRSRPGMTILDALLDIALNVDGSLSVRYNCRMALCGSCGMVVNGKMVLACQTQVSEFKSNELVIEPLPNYPIIKDLVVDYGPLLEKYRSIKPHFITNDKDLGLELLQSPEERAIIDDATRCLLCGICTAACPISATTDRFIGPTALINAFRFIADSRDEAKEMRLRLIDSSTGVWMCHQAQACNEVCPKNLKPAWAIVRLRRTLMKSKLRLPR